MKITITQKHIERGIKIEPQHCMMAIALNEQVPTCEVIVGVGRATFIPLALDCYCPIEVPLCDDARWLITRFDCGWLTPKRWWQWWKPDEYVFDIAVPESLAAPQGERPSALCSKELVAC